MLRLVASRLGRHFCRIYNCRLTLILDALDYGLVVFCISLSILATERALSKLSLLVLLSHSTMVQLFRARRSPMTRHCSNIFLFKPSRLSERCPQKNQRS